MISGVVKYPGLIRNLSTTRIVLRKPPPKPLEDVRFRRKVKPKVNTNWTELDQNWIIGAGIFGVGDFLAQVRFVHDDIFYPILRLG